MRLQPSSLRSNVTLPRLNQDAGVAAAAEAAGPVMTIFELAMPAACCSRCVFSLSNFSLSAFVIRDFLGTVVPRGFALPLPAAVELLGDSAALAAREACVTPVVPARARPRPRPLPRPDAVELVIKVSLLCFQIKDVYVRTCQPLPLPTLAPRVRSRRRSHL